MDLQGTSAYRNQEKSSEKKFLCADLVLLTLVILMSLGTAIYSNYPAFFNDYIKTDDARANIFWFHQLLDGDLFQGDLLTEYSKFFQAPGFIALYTLASHLIDPFLLAKIIPVALYGFVGIILYRMGKNLTGPYGGFIFALLFICYPSHLDSFNCGYSRIFAYPGLLLFLYFLISRKTLHLIWLIPCLALFYPIAFLICSVTYFLWVLLRITWAPVGIPPGKLILRFLAPMVISGCLILPKYAVPDNRFGRLLNYEETIHSPSTHPGGRTAILPPQPLRKKIIKVLNQPFVILSFLCIFYFLGRESLKTPVEFWLFALSGLLLYKLAYAFLLHLYFPYKYFRYSFPLALFLIMSFGLGRVVEGIAYPRVRALALVALIGAGHYFYGDTIKQAAGMQNYSDKAPLYEYLKTLPKASLIAAPPFLPDNIPLFAGRKVLFNYELTLPWFTGYGKMIRQRTKDFFFAYYSDRREDLMKFAGKYGIDYLIVDRKLYRYLGRKRFYINPYNDFIRKQVKKRNFYLRENLARLAQYRFDRYYVIKMESINRMPQEGH